MEASNNFLMRNPEKILKFYTNSAFNIFPNTLYFVLLILIIYYKENVTCFFQPALHRH